MSTRQKLKKNGLKSAKLIADWLCSVQTEESDGVAESGRFLWMIDRDGKAIGANNWNMAFAVMGLLAAAEEFSEPRYEDAALSMGRYLKTLQIFDPFKPRHYGAIREMTAQTPWCYTRDALSAAWAFIELYRHTNDIEYLKRAELWGEWFLKEGMDQYGWPLWGIQFEPFSRSGAPQICNDMHGSFQGGSLNFFYQLYLVSGDKKWIGDFFVKIADRFIDKIQQPNGFFHTIEAATGEIPEDPQNGLHRANDDLGSLGLLCAYQVTGDRRYVNAIDRFIEAVFAKQQSNGHFEDSCAAVPVILNTLLEGTDEITFSPKLEQIEKALTAFFSRQVLADDDPRFVGGIDELGDGGLCARSACYGLIFFLKYFGSKQIKILSAAE